ncbi:MAG: hypothetical protein JRI92_10085 [Deltaproteobacteria bacterium]|nr:hypothetical protein [Deltaproteobacteria bacterium]
MWEIIADAKEYGIEVLEEGINNRQEAFEDQDRTRWAEEIGTFAIKMSGLAEKAKQLQQLLISAENNKREPVSKRFNFACLVKCKAYFIGVKSVFHLTVVQSQVEDPGL